MTRVLLCEGGLGGLSEERDIYVGP
jgi:hypothetical protein